MAKPQHKSEFAVIGLGRFGASVAQTLTDRGFTVLGIDRNMRVVQELADEITQTVALDATDEDALRAVDIAIYPTVIVAIGADFQSKMLTTLALKSVGVKRLICTASNEREKAILTKIGADEVVLPEYDIFFSCFVFALAERKNETQIQLPQAKRHVRTAQRKSCQSK